MNKIQNLHDLEYYTNAQLCIELASKWSKAKPDNKEIQALSKALTEIAFYVVRIQQDIALKDKIASDYRYEKNKVSLELQELYKKFNNLKNLELNG
tara:strand:+ start:2144 stop:2431 length:288 start_codon:yes stop_codon:yes gene_type:complete